MVQRPEPTTAYLQQHQNQLPIPELPGSDWSAYFDLVYGIPWLTFNEHEQVFRETSETETQPGDTSRNRVIVSLLGIAATESSNKNKPGLDIDDLMQIASAALVKSVHDFSNLPESKRGKITPYLQTSIRRVLGRAILEERCKRGLNSRIYQEIIDFRRAEKELFKNLGRQPTVWEIAAAIGVSPERGYQISFAETAPLLFSTAGQSGIRERVLPETSTETPEQKRREILFERALLLMGPKPSRALQLSYGLLGEGEHDSEDIAKELGFSTKSATTILSKARDQFAELWPQLEAGTFDYIKWRQGKTFGRNVLTFLAMAGVPIPDRKLIDLRMLARQHLQKLQEEGACTPNDCGLLKDLYGLDDAGVTLSRAEVTAKWKPKGRRAFETVEEKALPFMHTEEDGNSTTDNDPTAGGSPAAND